MELVTLKNFSGSLQRKSPLINKLPPHNRFTALVRDHLGEPVPEENFWTYGAIED